MSYKPVIRNNWIFNSTKNLDSRFSYLEDAVLNTNIRPSNITNNGGYQGEVLFWGNDTLVEGKMYSLVNGTWTLSDNTTENTVSNLIGIALGTNSGTNGVLLKGLYKFASDPGSQQGQPLFIDTAGDLSDTSTSASGEFVKIVAYNLSDGLIWFNPSQEYLELA